MPQLSDAPTRPRSRRAIAADLLAPLRAAIERISQAADASVAEIAFALVRAREQARRVLERHWAP